MTPSTRMWAWVTMVRSICGNKKWQPLCGLVAASEAARACLWAFWEHLAGLRRRQQAQRTAGEKLASGAQGELTAFIKMLEHTGLRQLGPHWRHPPARWRVGS